MKHRIKKKFLWLDVWNIEEQEAWFSDMASQGWKLISTDGWYAKFEKCEPEKVNYRCDVFKLKDGGENNPIELYKEAGWEYVASRRLVHIFRTNEDANIVEIHTDPNEQAETLSILKKNITRMGIAVIFLSMLIILITLASIRIDPVDNYLNNKFIEVIAVVLASMYISISMITGIVHMYKLMRKLKSGSLFEHRIEYKRKINKNRIIGIIVNSIILLWVISNFGMLIGVITKDRFPAIPEKEIPVIKMSDIMDETTYIKKVDPYENKGDGLNYYIVNSSLLVPKQYELNENVEVPGVMWEDESGIYSPSIYSYAYETRGEWVAKGLAKELLKKYDYYSKEGYRYVQDSEFDDLWIGEEEFSCTFIGRKGKNLYRVVYYGIEPVEKIIELVLDKVENQ
ncbi:DUF2812 domain-containing protein [uncultured Clostridium sp.]|uniref:DUF2812 domain-containing protein n=1 Tax=uncultured Clostridium sp. TaxID=59620 RepID=UPI0028E9EE14|nr:DUF2812 domain-containing protein [uncultured Clostridium sp.]